ncbi:PEP-CTERM sorting domain-containing protein [Methyloversatilis sp. XJ19-13]
MILSSAGKFSYKQIPSIPEPEAWVLLLSGFTLIVAGARRKVSVN